MRTRRGPRVVVALGLVLAVGGLFGALVVQLRAANDADLRFVAAERQGVTYLRPLTRLIAELTNARSTAVRGLPADNNALNAAVAAVADVDQSNGAALRTGQRWADLRADIDAVMASTPTGRAALDRFGDLMVQATELGRTVGDTSNLILDPEADTFYLMYSVLLQMPTVLTATGLAADVNHLAATGKTVPPGRVDNADLIEIAVARQQVAVATEAIGIGLRKSMDATTSAALAASLTEPLDAFRTAVDRTAAPAALRQAAEPTDSAALFAATAQVREAALPLVAAVLSGLDGLLTAREDRLYALQLQALATTGAGVVLGIILLWWSVTPSASSAGAGEDQEGGPPLDVASVSVQLPAVDARDLLALEELVHVGRGVRARPKDEADDAR
jgi:hypothetical protein